MSATQRARSGVPLDARSVLPTVPGLPAWGAVLVAVGAAFVGFLLDSMRGTELTSAFSIFYFLGCVGAVLAVRSRGLFTTMVQPPLILVVAVPMAYQHFSTGPSGGMKDLILNAAIPLVNRFPLMLLTTLAVLAIGLGRMYMGREADKLAARPRRKSAAAGRSEQPARQSADRAADAPRSARTAPPTGRFPTGQHSTGARPVVPERPRETERTQEVAFDSAPIRQQRRPEPVRRPVPPQHGENLSRRPERGPAPVRTPQFSRPSEPEMPMHPIPQVRYRDRYDAPTDQPRHTR
ncbi:DUF6542 domain-containing protein [Rhodococcus sp. NPDC059234]|uniref:DUF6542 domain-containing protein n=1 Tax=Rhodococcus sp. NPDC059234 TaxID=3346781 RepID=UPI00366D1B30